MTEQNFKCWGRLIAFGAVPLTGCGPAPDALRERSEKRGAVRVSPELERVMDDSLGIVCYLNTRRYQAPSCVKVKP